MTIDIENANRFADSVLALGKMLEASQERMELVCTKLKEKDENEFFLRAYTIFNNLTNSITTIKRIAYAVRRIGYSYSVCEKRVEERYDSLWYIEKKDIPMTIDLSRLSETMKDVTFI